MFSIILRGIKSLYPLYASTSKLMTRNNSNAKQARLFQLVFHILKYKFLQMFLIKRIPFFTFSVGQEKL